MVLKLSKQKTRYIINMTQNKKCSRCCSSTLTENDFGKDKYDNYFKTCNACRDYSNQRKANNKDQVQQYAKEYYQANKEHKLKQCTQWRETNIERLTEKILCVCGGKHQYRTKAEHERSAKHQKYISNQNPPMV